MKKVGLLIVATNKYTSFLPALLESVDRYFLKDCDVSVNIFTDKVEEVLQMGDYLSVHKIEHKPFPLATYHRFKFFEQHKNYIPKSDYYFYIDADTIITSPITSEILGERVGTTHCGYMGTRGTYETRPESVCCIADNEGTMYYGGGFWGFSSNEFWRFNTRAVEMIDIDERKGIMPVWHDESILNRYFVDNPPTVVLSPSYHYPEGNIDYYKSIWGRDFICKILLLDKDHSEFRT